MKFGEVMAVICTFTLIALLAIFVFTSRFESMKLREENNKTNQEETNTRFEEVYRQETNDTTLIVIVDRETDVQYLISNTAHGTGIATMRDTNGAVLLRE